MSAAAKSVPLRDALRGSGPQMALTAGLNWVASAGYYVVFVWFVIDMTQVLRLPYRTALGIGTLGLVAGLLATLGRTELSDRIGQRPLLAVGSVATTVFAVPLLMLAATHGVVAVTLAQLGLAGLGAIFSGTLLALFLSLHRTATRCTSLALGYNAALALFGGTAPLVATLLIELSGWTAAPGLYLVANALVCRALIRFVPSHQGTR